ncbi:MAG: MoxR family ATPase [Pyrinomonadaceae bacterium]|nr:MoxR family ATPase [Phycisphaerales bacterium]
MPSPIERLRASIGSVFLGNAEAVDRIICCLIARGHVLIEDVPGVGKTVLASAVARSMNCTFSRIQLTPDMLPGDILGVSVFRPGTPAHDDGTRGGMSGALHASLAGHFEFKKGPIFANIVLADEINRTPPRTQTALLEAMNEATVTIDSTTYKLDQPFMIVATQNPDDFEGTYLLPENQLDRFLMRINLGYPSAADEARVLSLRPADNALQHLQPVMTGEEVVLLQKQADGVRMDRALIDYIISLAHATRQAEELRIGLSPRGSMALAQAARATAVLSGREYVIPEDITDNVVPVCAHRVITRSYAGAGRRAGEVASDVLRRVLETIDSPR